VSLDAVETLLATKRDHILEVARTEGFAAASSAAFATFAINQPICQCLASDDIFRS
jgi:hypothetical protein